MISLCFPCSLGTNLSNRHRHSMELRGCDTEKKNCENDPAIKILQFSGFQIEFPLWAPYEVM